MRLIRPHLYIGDILDANNVAEIQRRGIQHVLSIGNFENADIPTMPEPIQHLRIPLLDMPNADLLSRLPEAVNFVAQGVVKGGCLVHCLAGVSRSASVILAYMMRTEQLAFADALESMRLRHSWAQPNPGFCKQLELWAKMGYDIDVKHPEFQQYTLALLRDSWRECGSVSKTVLASDPGKLSVLVTEASASTARDGSVSTSMEAVEASIQEPVKAAAAAAGVDASNTSQQQRASTLFRCRKCRRLLASTDNAVPHDPGEGTASFKWHKQERSLSALGMQCSSYFLEPMQWMAGINDGQVEGKLLCPKCSTRLGSYKWAGEQCSCGAWVTPAFMLHKSKLDELPATIASS